VVGKIRELLGEIEKEGFKVEFDFKAYELT
jgi:hypothetical protein